jgi:hypothetical protein
LPRAAARVVVADAGFGDLAAGEKEKTGPGGSAGAAVDRNIYATFQPIL